jgi:hypothetical protein
MRVCPCCGFIDPACWKHVKFSYHIDTCNFETFKMDYPELAQKLQKGGDITEDKDNYYRLTKNKLVVMRKAKIEWTENNPFGAEKYERFAHTKRGKKSKEQSIDDRKYWRVHPNQQKLVAPLNDADKSKTLNT